MRFKDKLSDRIHLTGNHLCVGIDPHHQTHTDTRSFFSQELQRIGVEAYLRQLTHTVLSGASGAAVVKFQSAFFEAYGALGVSVLEDAIRMARSQGFLTILDAKRGDISSTMNAYGLAAFDRMGADALTVTAYMGTDVLEALKPWGLKGFGAYVVWISSNPSGAEIQDAILADGGGAVSERLQSIIDAWEQRSGTEGMTGYVLGATKLESALIDKISRTERFFLMPGVGAQGGKIDDVLRSILKRHPCTLVAISRTLTGIGSSEACWQSIDSWDHYREAVAKACAEAMLSLRAN